MVAFSDLVAVVSLVISIIAFVVAIAQALQQYVSSADGYRKCAKSIMGLWAEGTRRRFRYSEVRFEVIFETPVLFLASPENKRGPVPARDIYNVDGSKSSYEKTLTMEPEEQKSQDEIALKNVHTADDERASWVTLLSTLQQAEREGRMWEAKHSMTPKGIEYQPPTYTICVQVQKRKRSWDYMPDSVTKAYATTTICHLVEMTALLGMYWRAFDPDSWNMRAEGNGFIMTSSLVQGLGLMVSFSITGRSTFQSTRTIPCIEIKELSFGSVPSIFGGQLMNFGTKEDVTRTLRFVGCHPETITKYREHPSQSYSVAFEIIAMLAQTFRLPGSNFKMIPNPTTELWTNAFSACALMDQFKAQLTELTQKGETPAQIKAILDACESLSPVWKSTDADIDIDLREAVHACMNSCTAYLQELSQKTVTSVVGMHLGFVLDENEKIDGIFALIDIEKGLMEHFFSDVRPHAAGYVVGNLPGKEVFDGMSLEKKREREDIWVTLVFRMCCWWMLHDFDETDIMILPPRLKGSRLPVYIL